MDIITLQEFANMMRISSKDARLITKQVGFPAVNIGRRVCIDREKMEIWISKNYGRSFMSYEESRDRCSRR